MKKFKCPYCGNNSYSFWQKLIAGGMASKGVACPKCGRHSVHGMKSNIFRSLVMVAAFIAIILNYNSESPDIVLCAEILAGGFIICKIANGLFFPLSENNRKDIR